jgi:hypothetical protein
MPSHFTGWYLTHEILLNVPANLTILWLNELLVTEIVYDEIGSTARFG